ncbi:Sialoadhesin [Aix galericulata]|nr:Sialoadhesin [Aix galericulata]
MAVATSPLQWLVLLASLVPPGFSSPLPNLTVALAGWDQEQRHGARGVAQGSRAPAATPHHPPLAFPPPAHGSWGVSYPPELRSITGSCVVFPCTLSFPESVSASKGIVAIWYKDYSNQKTVVYHSEGQDVDARFRDRAQLLGDPAAHNCTLLLRGVTPEDSGPYKFRFEIIDGDRWSAEQDVVLSVSDVPERPSIAASEEVSEGTEVTLQCSTPYVCPLSDVALRWAGYDERVSSVSGRVQLDTSGVGHHLSLATSFSWKDHARELFCEVLHGSQKASGELVLRVRRTWGGSRRGTGTPLPLLCHPAHSPATPRSPRAGCPQLLPPRSSLTHSHPAVPPLPSPPPLSQLCPLFPAPFLRAEPLRAPFPGIHLCASIPGVPPGFPSATAPVRVPPADAPKGTRVSISPSAQNILVGDTVSLSCEVNSSYPPVSAYQWYKDGAAAGTERTLTLRGVRRADHGRYRCEAHNALGAGTAPPVLLYVFCKCRGGCWLGGGHPVWKGQREPGWV